MPTMIRNDQNVIATGGHVEPPPPQHAAAPVLSKPYTIDAIEPVTPARFEVIPELAGVFPIRLIEADRRIGRLDVRP